MTPPVTSEKADFLIQRAKMQFGIIYPCTGKKYFEECFTVADDKLYFWFNTMDKSTRMMSMDL